MRNFAKMAMMSGSPDRSRTYMGYGTENRNGSYDRGGETGGRATRGTLTWDNTRGAESAYRGGYGGMNYPRADMGEVESRRRRDSRGRFRSEMDGGSGGEMHYPGSVPPIYEEYNEPRQIGFSAHGGAERNNLHMIRGGASHDDLELDEDMAYEWMENLQNEDGTKGPHWTKEQTTQVMKQKNLNLDPLEFWVAINAVYSDYFGVAKKMNVNNIDFYTHMAKAFIEDKDSQPNRLARYYEYVTKH